MSAIPEIPEEPKDTDQYKVFEAKKALKHLQDLSQNPSFAWFMKILADKATAADDAMKICAKSEVGDKRDLWRVIDDISKLPDTLKIDCEKVIDRNPIDKPKNLL